MSDRVGFIGLGTMGGPMATNLARAGVSLVAHDANPVAAGALVQLPGVVVAAWRGGPLRLRGSRAPGGGMAHGTYFERRAKRIIRDDFSPTFMAQLMLKDARLATDLARAGGVPAPLLWRRRGLTSRR